MAEATADQVRALVAYVIAAQEFAGNLLSWIRFRCWRLRAGR